MNMNTNVSSLFHAVMALDLGPIKVKLMHIESGEGWSLEKTDAVEKEYRRFLCLMKMYPNEDTAPLVDVDTFWHYHILDTMKYARDCEQAFGYFLHHYPYVGLRGEDDAQFRLDSGERMRTLYEATFGDIYPGATAFCAGPTPQAASSAAAAVDAAFCAGPTPQTAFCAGPTPQLAFCAGPTPHTGLAAAPAANTAKTAFCAGPTPQTAFCAGPTPHTTVAAASAVKTAFCAGPTPHQLAGTAPAKGASRSARAAEAIKSARTKKQQAPQDGAAALRASRRVARRAQAGG